MSGFAIVGGGLGIGIGKPDRFITSPTYPPLPKMGTSSRQKPSRQKSDIVVHISDIMEMMLPIKDIKLCNGM